MSEDKLIYEFDISLEKSSFDIDVLGNKGAKLCEMCCISIPVPPGFIISSNCSNPSFDLESISGQVLDSIKRLRLRSNSFLEDIPDSIFMFSVRSGSKYSMPGMMDTILNVGLNDKCLETKNRFIYDSYRRLIQMYASSVLEIDSQFFDNAIEDIKFKHAISNDSEMNLMVLQELIKEFKAIISKNNKILQQDPNKQLLESIKAVVRSWNSKRAVTYRNANKISHSAGTAVIVQTMVFGNFNNNSGSGVVFSRNPSSGENKIFGEYLVNAQGEDIVSGFRTPQSIESSMSKHFPKPYSQLKSISKKLEKYFEDVQDIEFTIQNNYLWILQTRSAKRSHISSIKAAVAMANEGIISKNKALMLVNTNTIKGILHSSVSVSSENKLISKGLPASPGAACGVVAFSIQKCLDLKKEGKSVILVRNDTTPEDINGMISSDGILTTRGGMTSHAAVVARGMGKVCVCGASKISINLHDNYFKCNDKFIVKSGDIITIDGSTGNIFLGSVAISSLNLPKEFYILMQWAEEKSSLKIMSNSDTITDVNISSKFNADGIGLCRTEHMFFASDRINTFRHLIIMGQSHSGHAKSLLEKIFFWQKSDFKELFTLMRDKDFTVRLLDPPLHEFLPKTEASIKELSDCIGISYQELEKKIASSQEINPMLGNRGCRIYVSYPEIYKTQIKAVLSATQYVRDNYNCDFVPSIMVPFVMCENEIKKIYDCFIEEKSIFNVECNFGAMIELPSAAFCANKIANYCDFFSFGTNDLTQTTLGLSRDDCYNFLESYIENEIIEFDPFVDLETNAVGELMKIARDRAYISNKKIKMGICGEHARSRSGVSFSINANFHYLSCSPYAIPSVRLMSAQYHIMNNI